MFCLWVMTITVEGCASHILCVSQIVAAKVARVYQIFDVGERNTLPSLYYYMLQSAEVLTWYIGGFRAIENGSSKRYQIWHEFLMHGPLQDQFETDMLGLRQCLAWIRTWWNSNQMSRLTLNTVSSLMERKVLENPDLTCLHRVVHGSIFAILIRRTR
jgi:hypothetical protein